MILAYYNVESPFGPPKAVCPSCGGVRVAHSALDSAPVGALRGRLRQVASSNGIHDANGTEEDSDA